MWDVSRSFNAPPLLCQYGRACATIPKHVKWAPGAPPRRCPRRDSNCLGCPPLQLHLRRPPGNRGGYSQTGAAAAAATLPSQTLHARSAACVPQPVGARCPPAALPLSAAPSLPPLRLRRRGAQRQRKQRTRRPGRGAAGSLQGWGGGEGPGAVERLGPLPEGKTTASQGRRIAPDPAMLRCAPQRSMSVPTTGHMPPAQVPHPPAGQQPPRHKHAFWLMLNRQKPACACAAGSLWRHVLHAANAGTTCGTSKESHARQRGQHGRHHVPALPVISIHVLPHRIRAPPAMLLDHAHRRPGPGGRCCAAPPQ